MQYIGSAVACASQWISGIRYETCLKDFITLIVLSAFYEDMQVRLLKEHDRNLEGPLPHVQDKHKAHKHTHNHTK